VKRCLEEAETQCIAPSQSGPARLIVPIRRGGKTLGVLGAERLAAFTPPEVDFLLHIASRASAAIENAQLYYAVQQANNAKSQFISVVSHELRIPMTSIKGYADLLRQGVVGPLNDAQRNFVEIIRNNVERMSILVSDLSDISRIETGRLKLERARVSVGEYIEQTMQSLRPKLEEKSQVLTIEVEPGLPEAYLDPNRLIQVLSNLVSNAWKYTPVGGSICISAHPQGAYLRIEVKDNGYGISPEDQKHVFSQFFRSEDSKVRDEQGWGLGLSVARQLVELMGGEMGFQSQLGAGSTFWFTVPTYT
jgi:signal transduction histidine kinase